MKKRVTIIAAFLWLWPGLVSAQGSIRAVYGNYSKNIVEGISELLKTTEVNAVVLDIKHDSGKILLETRHKAVITLFKSENAYVICRIVTFKDSTLSKTREGYRYAIKSRSGGHLWTDYKGNNWLDPAAEDIYPHIVKIAQDGVRAGCDEINFDYIRFPSSLDSDLGDAEFPYWRAAQMGKCQTLKRFIDYLSKHLTGIPVSIDVFGYTFIYGNEPGIGQCLGDFARAGFILAPMLYPTHFSCNDKNFHVPDPSLAPYEVYAESLRLGTAYLRNLGVEPKVRPWLQAFDTYNICRYSKKMRCPKKCGEEKIFYNRVNFRAQIYGAESLQDPAIVGWMSWNPDGKYSIKLFNSR